MRPEVINLPCNSEEEEVRTLREIHDTLCDVAAQVDAVYGLPMLGCLSTHLFNCITVLNLLLSITLEYQGSAGAEMEGLAMLAIVWALFYFGGFLAVTWSCSTVASECCRTADLVLKALLRPPRNTTTDTELWYQLQMFLQQLLHRRPRFTACGFFVIDLTNIPSMVAAAVSYLVVIAQASAKEEFPEENEAR
ncbi:putative gustatory receptor 28a [Schistocerca nitens]|uniref:putative gustatory receptor 28a n=1 Tax=Schistocerca nitens TaxID=7011 RepID=UPI002118BD54|nr:putative gustatory receptor 28a [Schistocerca nitens]